MYAAGIWFENALMQVVLRHLTDIDVTDPIHRYLLIEVADECRHSAMFGEFIRRAGTPSYAPQSPGHPRRDLQRAGAVVPADPRRSRSCSTTSTGRRCATTVCTRSRVRSPACTCSRRPATSASPSRTSPRCGRRSTPADQAGRPRRRAGARRRRGVAQPQPDVFDHLGIAGGAEAAAANPHYRSNIVAGLAKLTSFLAEIGIIDPLDDRWADSRPRPPMSGTHPGPGRRPRRRTRIPRSELDGRPLLPRCPTGSKGLAYWEQISRLTSILG